MIDLPAFERDPYLAELSTEVLEAWEARGDFFAVLQDTLFFPEGGGQPADLGALNGIRVLDVQKERCYVLGAETDRMGGHIRTSWSFVLEPIGSDATHLITRVRGIGDPPWSAWLQGAVLFPPIHALMQHAQLKNLKKLAEALACTRVAATVIT